MKHVIHQRRVVVCAGPGGVGKTTVAAALGLAAARDGLRALCLTIDPAKRLANSLGLSEMTAEEQAISSSVLARAGVGTRGSLTVMMLDAKRTFDDLVASRASSPEARDRILNNRIYQYVSTSLAGTQAYMAMEKLLSVKQDQRFDLIVLDTPPTSHALDFLDAPDRLVDAIDSPAMRTFAHVFERSGRFSLKLVTRGLVRVFKSMSRLTGSGFLDLIAEFVMGMNDLFGGFKERAQVVSKAFRGSEFAYVLVATPAPFALAEARFFSDRLQDMGVQADALVINRVHAQPGPVPEATSVRERLNSHGLQLGENAVERLQQALLDEISVAEADAAALQALKQPAFSGLPRVRVELPAFPTDVHDLDALMGIAKRLLPT